MVKIRNLSPEELRNMETDIDSAIKMFKSYSSQYQKNTHYYLLGSSCVATAVGTVNSIIYSSKPLNGNFIMPDQINVEKLVEWFMKNKEVDCNRVILTFFTADYIKRKINKMYKSINKISGNELDTSITILGNDKALKRYRNEIEKRKKIGVKIIRKDSKL